MRLLLILLTFSSFSIQCQENREFDWVNLSLANAFTSINCTGVDKENNIYHCGVLSNSGQMNFHDEDLFDTNSKEYGYISKVDSNGNYIWGIDFTTPDSPGASYPWFQEMEIAENGDVVILGHTTYLVDFDPSPDTVYLYPGYGADPFVLRYSSDGELIWAKTFASVATNKYGHTTGGLALDTDGNVYISGHVKHAFDLDPSSQSFIIEPTNHAADVGYLVKLSPEGNFIWGNEYDHVNTGIQDIHVDNNGDIVASGFFYDSLRIQSQFLDTLLTTGLPQWPFIERSFVFKTDSSGNETWVSVFYGANVKVEDIDTDESNNIYLTGTFYNSIVYESGNLSNSEYSVGGKDLFMMKRSMNGDFIWGKRIGSKWEDETSKSQYYNGDLYVHISEGDTLYFGNDTIVFPEYYYDFILRCNSQGDLVEQIEVFDLIYYFSDFTIDNTGSIISSGRCNNSGFFNFIDFDPSEAEYYHWKKGQAVYLHKIVNRIYDLNGENFLVFPNPSNGMVKIVMDFNEYPKTLDVIDLSGKKIESILIDEYSNEIDLHHLSAGVYLIKGYFDNKVESHRLIKL